MKIEIWVYTFNISSDMEEGFVIISMNIICFTSRKDSVVLDQVKNGHDQKGMVHHT